MAFLPRIDMPRLLRTVDNLLSAGKLSASTQRTYAVCWGKFERWAAENSLSALPATEATVLLYLASRAGSAKDRVPQGVRIVSQFDALRECGGCRHWMSGRYRNSPDIGTCGLKNKINGHDITLRDDYCGSWQGKDSGPIAGTLEYLREANRG